MAMQALSERREMFTSWVAIDSSTIHLFGLFTQKGGYCRQDCFFIIVFSILEEPDFYKFRISKEINGNKVA